jgi:hypothetical protein
MNRTKPTTEPTYLGEGQGWVKKQVDAWVYHSNKGHEGNVFVTFNCCRLINHDWSLKGGYISTKLENEWWYGSEGVIKHVQFSFSLRFDIFKHLSKMTERIMRYLDNWNEKKKHKTHMQMQIL